MEEMEESSKSEMVGELARGTDLLVAKVHQGKIESHTNGTHTPKSVLYSEWSFMD
jgi:hypothetical protein